MSGGANGAGGAVRYSIDGGAVVAAAGTGDFDARNGDPVRIGSAYDGSLPSAIPLAYLAVLPGVVADGDTSTPGTLRYLSNNPSVGYPDLTGITPDWSWAAAQYCGAQVVAIAGTRYAMVGAPQVWVP